MAAKHFHRMPDGKIGCWQAQFSENGKVLGEPIVHEATVWEIFAPNGVERVRTAYCDEHAEDPAKNPDGNTRLIKIRQ